MEPTVHIRLSGDERPIMVVVEHEGSAHAALYFDSSGSSITGTPAEIMAWLAAATEAMREATARWYREQAEGYPRTVTADRLREGQVVELFGATATLTEVAVNPDPHEPWVRLVWDKADVLGIQHGSMRIAPATAIKVLSDIEADLDRLGIRAD